MRFFSGNRTEDKKPASSAAMQFKAKMLEKQGKALSFDERLDAKVNKIMGDYTKARQKTAQMSGKSADDVPQLSKNAKDMLNLLARKQLQKEIKKEKQLADAKERAEKRKKNAEMLAQKNLQYQNDLKAKQLAEAEALASQTPAKSYFFGYSEEE